MRYLRSRNDLYSFQLVLRQQTGVKYTNKNWNFRAIDYQLSGADNGFCFYVNGLINSWLPAKEIITISCQEVILR
jgi:hypothetical protein